MQKTKMKQITIWILLFALCFSFFSCSQLNPDNANGSVNDNPSNGNSTSLDADIYNLIATIREYSSYPLPEDFDPTGLTPQEIVAATNDPYSQYFTLEEYLEYSTDLNGNFVGIGVTIDYPSEEFIRILYVFDDSPAKVAGLLAHDEILAVNGKEISLYEKVSDARDDIVGLAGTDVTLTIRRGVETFDVVVTRNNCTKQTVFYRTVEQDDLLVGYVHITTFDAITTSQFISAVSTLEAQGIDAMVFDLRFDGGGLLRTVCEMLAYLLPDGVITTIDYTSDTVSDLTIYSEDDTLYYLGNALTTDSYGYSIQVEHEITYPVAILTNGNTASASELFTASLLDYSKTDSFVSVITVGSKTYGKGCMQSSFRLSNGNYLKMTIALFNPPTSDNFNGIGISATVEIEDPYDATYHIYFQDIEDIALSSAISYIKTHNF